MSVAKDSKTGKWYSKFRYTDWTGKRVQKKKTGFITKREAQEWEREFLTKAAASCDMSFASLVELYMADCKTRLRATTWENKQHLITKKTAALFRQHANKPDHAAHDPQLAKHAYGAAATKW